MSDFCAFATQKLIPAARDILLRRYKEHKNGANIDITGKNDGSPASRADRESEAAMRILIRAAYPDHGIIGEEHGAENQDAEYVWVLDPLDGTKEFLDLHEGWCILIALLHHGKPVVGVIDDPLNNITYNSGHDYPSSRTASELTDSTIACTAPATMFTDTTWEDSAKTLLSGAKQLYLRGNGIGFAHVATGKVDLAVEAGLKLHDIAALLPVLWQAGATTLAPGGGDYKDHTFDMSDIYKNYALLTSRNMSLAAQALDLLENSSTCG